MHTGKQTRRFLLLSFSAAVLLAVTWLIFGYNRQPRYQGHPVSYWIREYVHDSLFGTESDESDESDPLVALQALGTNALPYLAEAAFNTPDYSHAQAAIHNFIKGLPGPNFLTRRPEPEETRAFALMAVSDMNLPSADLSPLLPGLQQTLLSTNDFSKDMATHILGEMGTNAMPAVPQLQNAFTSEPDWQKRNRLAVVLCKIDAHQTNALGYLIGGLRGGQSGRSALSLGNIGTNARPAIPALLDLLRGTTNANLVVALPDVLQKVGASVDEVLPTIRNKLQDSPDPVRISICQAILKFNPADPEVISNLVEMAKREGEEHWIAIAILNNPHADEAIPHLRKLLIGTNTQYFGSASEALKQIQAKKP